MNNVTQVKNSSHIVLIFVTMSETIFRESQLIRAGSALHIDYTRHSDSVHEQLPRNPHRPQRIELMRLS